MTYLAEHTPYPMHGVQTKHHLGTSWLVPGELHEWWSSAGVSLLSVFPSYVSLALQTKHWVRRLLRSVMHVRGPAHSHPRCAKQVFSWSLTCHYIIVQKAQKRQSKVTPTATKDHEIVPLIVELTWLGRLFSGQSADLHA